MTRFVLHRKELNVSLTLWSFTSYPILTFLWTTNIHVYMWHTFYLIISLLISTQIWCSDKRLRHLSDRYCLVLAGERVGLEGHSWWLHPTSPCLSFTRWVPVRWTVEGADLTRTLKTGVESRGWTWSCKVCDDKPPVPRDLQGNPTGVFGSLRSTGKLVSVRYKYIKQNFLHILLTIIKPP